MPNVIAVSPHLDDAAFSAGGTLACLASAGWTVEVVTVFTASVLNPCGFALACQLDKGLSGEDDYMAIRRAEDAVACSAMGTRPTWLPLHEAPHRGYESASALFGPIRSDDRAEDAVVDILLPMFSERRPDLIMAPQAIGGHVDHAQVVRALRRLAWPRPTLWWADWPYIARPNTHPARPFASDMAGFASAITRFDPTQKRSACRAYTTQLDFQFGGESGLDRALEEAGGEERFLIEGEVDVRLGGIPLLRQWSVA